MAVRNTLATRKPQGNAMVYQTDTGEIKLSPATVRQFLVNGNGAVTDQEVTLFMALCKGQKLNPFIKEAYLIKYGNTQPATVVVSKDVFQKRADQNPNYDGKRAGVIVEDEDSHIITYREGEFYLKGSEKLLGGWCEVYRKDRDKPERAEVLFEEYAGYSKDGKLNSNWSKRPATMIRKVAVAHALRDAFPRDFQGLYTTEEMGVEATETFEMQSVPVNENTGEVIDTVPVDAEVESTDVF